MKWICLQCNWTGSSRELDDLGGIRTCCPLCGGEVDEDDGPDPLDEASSIYLHDQMNAIRGQL